MRGSGSSVNSERYMGGSYSVFKLNTEGLEPVVSRVGELYIHLKLIDALCRKHYEM